MIVWDSSIADLMMNLMSTLFLGDKISEILVLFGNVFQYLSEVLEQVVLENLRSVNSKLFHIRENLLN